MLSDSVIGVLIGGGISLLGTSISLLFTQRTARIRHELGIRNNQVRYLVDTVEILYGAEDVLLKRLEEKGAGAAQTIKTEVRDLVGGEGATTRMKPLGEVRRLRIK